MITSLPLSLVTTAVQTVDLYVPLIPIVNIIVEKPELSIYKIVTPSVTVSDKWTIFSFCTVDLVDEDLSLGKIYLPNFGDYKITIMSDTNIAWLDTMKHVGSEINYN